MTDDPNTLLILGEIRGQLRELVHNSNNNAQEIRAVGMRLGKMELVTAKFEDTCKRIEDHDERIDMLVADKQRRDGAIGLVEWLAKNWPVLGLIVAAVAAALIVQGRLQ